MFCFSDVEEVVRKTQMSEVDVMCRNLDLVQQKVNDKVHWKTEVMAQKKNYHEFKKPESYINIDQFSKKRFAPQSRRKILWAVNLYTDWRKNRIVMAGCSLQIVNANLESVGIFAKGDLCHSLSCFVREVKKIDGSDYPPNTVRELVLMIQMFSHEKGVFWKLLDDVQFAGLCDVVDNTMKECHAAGLGVRKSSDIISLENEEKLFNKGLLGDESPMQLLKTMIYMMGMHCALRGGVEHSNLRWPGCSSQFNIERDMCGVEMLVYREDPLQKTNQGLVSKAKRKIVYIYGASNVRHCPIAILKKYCRLLPDSKTCRKLYLRCRKVPTLSVWYCDQPYGVNKIKSTMKDLCKEAGIEGNFTNHSLRASCASRMYDKNVPEQVIKEVTGHRSECVRLYKRTSDHIREAASNTVCGESLSKRVKLDEGNVKNEEKKGQLESKGDEKKLSYAQMMRNVLKTRQELRKKATTYKVKAKKLVQKAKKFTIDLNLNMKLSK